MNNNKSYWTGTYDALYRRIIKLCPPPGSRLPRRIEDGSLCAVLSRLLPGEDQRLDGVELTRGRYDGYTGRVFLERDGLRDGQSYYVVPLPPLPPPK